MEILVVQKKNSFSFNSLWHFFHYDAAIIPGQENKLCSLLPAFQLANLVGNGGVKPVPAFVMLQFNHDSTYNLFVQLIMQITPLSKPVGVFRF